MDEFKLDNFPDTVTYVKLVVEVEPRLSGFVLCHVKGHDPWVVWRYYRNATVPTRYVWGHYFQGLEEATKDLLDRAGIRD